MPSVDVEVLLPVHNEGESIEATIRGIYAELSKVVSLSFIVCEDGSRDNTKDVLRKLATKLPIRLNLSDERKGYSRAVREGMEMLESSHLLCLDSDGQCDPEDFRSFWEARSSGEIIYGWRVKRADPFVRRFCSGLFYVLYQLVFRVPVHDPSCPYVLMSKTAAKNLCGELGAMEQGFWWEFIARAYRRGYTIVELPVHHRTRAAGKTQVYQWSKMPGIFIRHVLALYRVWSETRS